MISETDLFVPLADKLCSRLTILHFSEKMTKFAILAMFAVGAVFLYAREGSK